MPVGIQLGAVPNGFELAAAGQSGDELDGAARGQSYLRLLKGQASYRGLTEPAPVDVPADDPV